jgi:hypothetical protein
MFLALGILRANGMIFEKKNEALLNIKCVF